MHGPIHQKHRVDDMGRPAGGVTVGRGFTIAWQDGPLASEDVTPDECVVPFHEADGVPHNSERMDADGRTAPCRRAPNGAFVEDVIAAAIGRIRAYQDSPFACEENADALEALEVAARRLDDRTRNRESRGVEGTHRQ